MFFLWLVGFAVAVVLIGFLPAMAVFVFTNMTMAHGRKPSQAALLGVCVSLFCWVVFHRLLQVTWPESMLGDALPRLREITGFI